MQKLISCNPVLSSGEEFRAQKETCDASNNIGAFTLGA